MTARLFCIGSMSAAQAEAVTARHGLELTRTPAGNFSMDEKRAKAIAYLRSRGKYILDQGSKRPEWRGLPDDTPSAA